MKMTVVSDVSQYQAAERLLKMVEGLQKEASVVVLTPENATLFAEEFLAKVSPNGAVSGLLVTNFSRLFTFLYPQYSVLSPQVSCMAVSRAMKNLSMLAFTRSKKRYGFARAAHELLELFGQSGVNLSSLEVVENSALGQKLSDLEKMAAARAQYLPQNAKTTAERMQLLLARAKQGYFSGKIVCFVGFDDISPAQEQVIEEVVKSATEVYVSGTEFDKTKVVNSPVMDVFLDIASRLSCSVSFMRKVSLLGRQLQIATGLFAEERVPQEVSGVSVVECKTRFDEAVMAASVVEHMVRKGLRYNDIQLVVPGFGVYQTVLEKEFSLRKIPLYADNSKSVETHPLFRLAEGFFRLCGRRKSVQDALSVLRNVLLGVPVNDLAVYQNHCEKYGIEFEELTRLLTVGENEKEFAAASRVQKIAGRIVKMLPSQQEKASGFTGALQAFFKEFGVEESLLRYEAQQTGPEEKEISGRVLEQLQNLCGQIEQVLGEEKMGVQQFLEVWKDGVSSLRLRLVPPVLDAVTLTDVSTSHHSPHPVVVVLGATEGDFPAVLSDSGVLTDAELAKIEEEYHVKVRPTVRRVNENQKQKVCEVFQMATEQLVVSYSVRVGGEQKQLSSVVQVLRSICLQNGQALPVLSFDIKMGQKNFFARAKSVQGAKQLVALLTGRTKGLRSVYGLHTAIGSLHEALKRTGNVLPEEKQVEESVEGGTALFFPNGTTSISQLESYFSCPYAHFARYGLGVKEKEVAAMRSLDIGLFLHRCLEEVTRRTMHQEKLVSDAQFASIMKEVLMRVVKEEKYQAHVNALQLEALKKEACRLCYAVLRQIDGSLFRPVAAELRFGKNGELPSVQLNGDVRLEGKIDRMDVCGDLVRLVDYKTGQIDLDLTNLYCGKKVQLFAYLLSVLEEGKYRPAGVFYLPVKSVFQKESNMLESYKMQGYFSGALDVVSALDSSLSFESPKSVLIDAAFSASKENVASGKKVLKPGAHILDDQSLVGLAGYAKKVATGAVEEMQQGNVSPRPLSMNGVLPCSYCAQRATCKIKEHPEWVREVNEKVSAAELLGAE